MNYPKEVLEIAERFRVEPSEVAEARSLSQAELESLADRGLSSGLTWDPDFEKLRLVADLIVPYLIGTIAQSDSFTPQLDGRRDSKAKLALLTLEKGAHPELKPVLKAWLAKNDKDINRAVRGHLIAFASDDLLVDYKALFESDDRSVRSGARGDALYPLKHGSVEPQFKAYLWDHCVELLHGPNPPKGFDPIRLLVLIDQEKSIRLLQAPKTLRLDHPLIVEVISNLRKLKSPPPAEFLLSIMDGKLSGSPSHQESLRDQALYGLVDLGHPRAKTHVDKVLGNPSKHDEGEVLAAWDARYRMAGLTTVKDQAFERWDYRDENWDSLSQPEKDMILIHYLYSEVGNGGFYQWYENSFGVHAKETEKALERIGAKAHAKIIAKANRSFGWFGPPSERSELDAKLEKMSNKDAEMLSALADKLHELPAWQVLAAEWDWKRQTSEN